MEAIVQGMPIDLSIIFGTFISMVAATMWLTNQVVIKANLFGWSARLSSWVVAFILVLLARYAFKIGYVMEYNSIWEVLVVGINVALVSNGVHTIEIAKKGLNKVSIKKK